MQAQPIHWSRGTITQAFRKRSAVRADERALKRRVSYPLALATFEGCPTHIHHARAV